MMIQNLKLPDGKISDAVTERLFHIVAQVRIIDITLLLYYSNIYKLSFILTLYPPIQLE